MTHTTKVLPDFPAAPLPLPAHTLLLGEELARGCHVYARPKPDSQDEREESGRGEAISIGAAAFVASRRERVQENYVDHGLLSGRSARRSLTLLTRTRS